MPAGKVATLPPAQDLSYAHHGNGKSGGIALKDDSSSTAACGVGGSFPGATPRMFNNPWPSYRFATLSDAIAAYQRGAAIATPQLPEAAPSRTPSRANTIRNGGNGNGGSQSRQGTLNSLASRSNSRTASRSESRADAAVSGGDDSRPLVDILPSSSPQPGNRPHSRSASAATALSSASNDSGSTADASAAAPLIKAQSHSRSVSDTTLLYHPQPRSPSWLKPDDPEDAAEEDEEGSVEGYDDDEAWSFQHPPGQPVTGYVRPAFSRIMTLDDEDDWREPPIRVERPRWSRGGDAPLVTWLGHAGALIQIPWANNKHGASRAPYCGIVFDPIFSYRCSPSQLVGPARHLDPPCTVSELPAIHACCISHDHYDHLDYQTIFDLWMCHMSTIHFFVPLGLKQWFIGCGIPAQRITELDWYHEAIISFPDSGDDNDDDDGIEDLSITTTTYPPENHEPARIDPSAALTLKFAFTPAQHRSGRGIFDHMTSLWGSWCVGVVGPGREVAALRPGMAGWDDFKVFFGGDTGYRYATAHEAGDESAVCPAFKEIADRYAPFTLTMLPLSTGSSLPFLRKLLSLSLDQYTLTSSQHCSPADSIEIHLTLRAKRSLGIHWGTFCDAAEARATRVEFGRARRDRNISNDWDESGEKGAFVVADIGLVMEIC